jgi:hypothetical protein
MVILMKMRESILAVTYGKSIGMAEIEGREFSRQLISFIPQIKRLDMTLDSEIEPASATHQEAR